MKIPWPRIVAHYRDLAACESSFAGLQALSDYVAAGALVDELYAWTTASDLCISLIKPNHTFDDTYLRISHNQDGSLDFRYVDTHAGGIRWHRRVEAEQAIPGFLLCLEQIRWNSGEALQA
jgi:hypothetical protein